MNKKVGITRCSSYKFDEVFTALKKAVELADGLDVKGKTVLLKPNILSDSAPEKAITTHPVFLEAAIVLVREMGAKRILVGDSPGMQAPGFSGKVSGLGEAAKRNGTEWVDFTKEKIEIPCPEGKAIKKFTLAKAVRDADYIISLPKLKTHQLMYYTGAMKNIFGCIPSLAKSPFHARFASREAFAAMLVDLNLAVKPSYAFMDAVVGMEGSGPAAGNPRHAGLIFASSNLLALDAAACMVIGYPPLEIPVNRDALGRRVWLSDFTEIEYPGLSPLDVRIPDFLKIPLKKTTSQFADFLLPRPIKRLRDSYAPGPEINHAACIRCGDCARICGSQAMSFAGEGKERRIAIDYNRCIRCFCCHEICPEKAIDVVRKPQNRSA
jgi:uncharacterized protein (DUF362 family)/Pyruvate/2-oxoacid:ferredoxin oxidoreductase delta subunit